MFQRFSNVEGFTYSEVLLCYAIILLEFALAEMIARGFDTFSGIVKSGELDRILVRPQSEIVQVLGTKFELTRIGKILQSIVMFLYSILNSNVVWNFSKVCTMIFMLIGGTVVFSALFFIYAALCFFTLEGLEVINIFTDGAREFGKYPVGIYGESILKFCTWVVPYALVQHYPLLYLLDYRTETWWSFVPLLASLFLIPCYGLWRLGVRRYQSAGS